ncbi:MAG: fibronectin type III domain-containing protein [bacterium]|nr:fibronectin type III domain-containing protein [bacterium]
MFLQKGFIALTTVLVVSVVVVAIAATSSLLSIGEAQSGLVLLKGEDNLHLVEGCMEDLLLKIRADQNFNQTTITLPEGSCNITYNSRDPSWDVTVSSGEPAYQRQVRVTFTRPPTGLALTSWQETAPVPAPTAIPTPTPGGPTPTDTPVPTPTDTPIPTPTDTPIPTPTFTPTPTPVGDTTSPAAVTDLATAAGSDPRTMVSLSWSAPADNVGVTSYDIRYNTATITEANWASATQANGEPTPSAPGTLQSFTVTGLTSNKTYYFAIKSSDAVANISAISNVPSRKTSR